MTTGKHVPLADVSRLRADRRRIQAKLALLEAEKEGWLVEEARLISALEGVPDSDFSFQPPPISFSRATHGEETA